MAITLTERKGEIIIDVTSDLLELTDERIFQMVLSDTIICNSFFRIFTNDRSELNEESLTTMTHLREKLKEKYNVAIYFYSGNPYNR